MRGPLVKVFPDALLNRLVVVPYYPITKEIMKQIIGLNLRRVERRVAENYKIPFTYEPAVPELIALRCTELERGARLVDAMITNQLLPEIGRELLTRLADGRAVKRIHLSAADGKFAYAFE
jgi:type VI secretion system protein VasG